MTSHAKSYLCKYCQDLKALRAQYFKMPCTDCRSYAKSFNLWLLCQYQLKLDDQAREITAVRQIVLNLYRWLAEDLKESLEEICEQNLSAAFAKATEVTERYSEVDAL